MVQALCCLLHQEWFALFRTMRSGQAGFLVCAPTSHAASGASQTVAVPFLSWKECKYYLSNRLPLGPYLSRQIKCYHASVHVCTHHASACLSVFNLHHNSPDDAFTSKTRSKLISKKLVVCWCSFKSARKTRKDTLHCSLCKVFSCQRHNVPNCT